MTIADEKVTGSFEVVQEIPISRNEVCEKVTNPQKKEKATTFAIASLISEPPAGI